MTRKNKARLVAAVALVTAPVWLVPAMAAITLVGLWRSAVTFAEGALVSRGDK